MSNNNTTDKKSAKAVQQEIEALGKRHDTVNEVYRRISRQAVGEPQSEVEFLICEALKDMGVKDDNMSSEDLVYITQKITDRVRNKNVAREQLFAVSDWRWHADKIAGGVYNTLAAAAVTAAGAYAYHRFFSPLADGTDGAGETTSTASNPFSDTTSATPRPPRSMRKAAGDNVTSLNA